ncbi:MAG TPA: plastocyanin/azurin family copper-binding protein [Vicinamibacterales bacterium]|nr:plastocyanin/azurin family copper-binding protein [Vicinamibacterales bacterium]
MTSGHGGTAFSPAELTVNAGDTVIWVNKDFYPHTATSKAPGLDSDDIEPEKSWKYVATKKGGLPVHVHHSPVDQGHTAGEVSRRQRPPVR